MLSRSALLLLASSLFAQNGFALPVASPDSGSSGSESSQDTDTATYVSSGAVMGVNFADPSIIKVDDTWWAFGTQGSDVHIQVASSPDFKNWTLLKGVDALPNPPDWVDVPVMKNFTELFTKPFDKSVNDANQMQVKNTWAPDVVQLDDGTFVMYFSAANRKDPSKHCIGAAKATDVKGPYIPITTELACPLEKGGAIDAAGFKDWEEKGSGWGFGSFNFLANADNDSWTKLLWGAGGKGGQRYLTYKIDGNSIGNGNAKGHGGCGNTIDPIVSTPIMLQAVAADGITTIGEPVQILDNNGLSDDGVVEAPSLLKTSNGTYVLFFSSGCYSSPDYTVSYASASNIQGPYERAAEPLLKTGDYGLTAPGGMDVSWDGRHMLFHADYPDTACRAAWGAMINTQDNGQKVAV